MHRSRVTRWSLGAAVALVVAPAALDAQGRGRDRWDNVPPGHLPPPGECRVWYDDVPPGRQPPPTSCAAARREASRTGGHVIYGGDDRYDRDRHDDRDRIHDRRDRDRRRDDEICIDRNRDGRCGIIERRLPNCVDRDRDGRCDDVYDDGRYDRDRDGHQRDGRYRSALPETIWAVTFRRGDRRATAGVRDWFGRTDVEPRYTDADRDGRPEVVSWFDSRGAIVQRWIDDNDDGRADRVAIYERGRVVRVLR